MIRWHEPGRDDAVVDAGVGQLGAGLAYQLTAVHKNQDAPATAGNPRPYGMPPFMLVLSDSEIANLLTYLRSAWGHQAGEVSALDVNRARSGPQR